MFSLEVFIFITCFIALTIYTIYRIVSDTKKLYHKTKDVFIKLLLWSKK